MPYDPTRPINETVTTSFDRGSVRFTFALPRGAEGADGEDGSNGTDGAPGEVSAAPLAAAERDTARNILAVATLVRARPIRQPSPKWKYSH
jgi:hypothetical protein